MTTLAALQAWYTAQCDGEWEHTYGIEVGTIDNPGWSVKINVVDTPLSGRPFEELRDHYDHETAWMRCWLEDDAFHGVCGPLRLEDVLRVFLEWSALSGNADA